MSSPCDYYCPPPDWRGTPSLVVGGLVTPDCPTPTAVLPETISFHELLNVCAYSSGNPTVEYRTITLNVFPGSVVGSPTCVVPTTCCPTSITCTACAGNPLPFVIYLTAVSGCIDTCYPTGPIYYNSAAQMWNYVGQCGVGVKFNPALHDCTCITLFTLRCSGSVFFVDISRSQILNDAIVSSDSHTSLPVTVNTCDPFCLSFTVPADSVCSSATDYCIEDTLAICCSSGTGSGGGGGCCDTEPTSICLKITGAESCPIPPATPLQMVKLAGVWKWRSDQVSICSFANRWFLSCANGVWSCYDLDGNIHNVTFVNVVCTPGSFSVSFTGTFNCSGCSNIPIGIVFTEGAC